MKQKRIKGSKTYEALRKILIAVVIIAGLFSEASNAAAVILGLGVFALICLGIYGYYQPYRETKGGVKPGMAGRGGTVGKKRPLIRPAKPAVGDVEEPLHCAHSRGKEKYFEQLDSFLQNGLIDKKEYQQLKARYSSLNIEEDYH